MNFFDNFALKLFFKAKNAAIFTPKVVGRVFEGIAIGVLANTLDAFFLGTLTLGIGLATGVAIVLLIIGANLEEDLPPP